MKCCKNIPTKSIMLVQGDDSNAMGGYIKITLTTEQDLTGWYLILQIANFQWRYDDLTSKELYLVVPREITAQMDIGATTAAIKIFDNNDLCRTVKDNIPVYVGKQAVANPTEEEPVPEETDNDTQD